VGFPRRRPRIIERGNGRRSRLTSALYGPNVDICKRNFSRKNGNQFKLCPQLQVKV
jgi:hypothetical protein